MGSVVTDRDKVWLGWMARWRAVTSGQVMERFGLSGESGEVIVRRRMRALRELGLVESMRVFVKMPSVHFVTREGISLLGLNGSARRPPVGTLRHDLAVVDCATWLERLRGVDIVTEREVRRVDSPSSSALTYALRVKDPLKADRRMLYPDFLVKRPDGTFWAQEVELARKDHDRLVALMESYIAAPHISRVGYYAHQDVRARVERAAEEANRVAAAAYGLGKTVFVMGWDWSE